MSFSQILNQDLEQGKLMAAVNSRNKGPKTISSNVRNRLKFGKISRKDLLLRKCKKKKMDIENFIVVAL